MQRKMNTNPTKITKLEQQINRLKSQRARLQHQQKKHATTERRQLTRTLIQLGGLFTLTPLLEQANITLGEDLQADIHAQD